MFYFPFPGADNFWTDDYKLFEQIVGKTSDRNLYRASYIPVPNNFGIDARNLQGDPQPETIEDRNERVAQEIVHNYYDNAAEATQQDPYQGQYANLVAQQTLKAIQKDLLAKPTKPSFKFVGYNEFKPISQNNDPETYDYYKQLELLSKQQAIGFPTEQSIANFKPYVVYGNQNPEQTDAYKSIQDILDAHESKKKTKPNQNKDNVDKENGPRYYNQGRSKKANVRYVNNDISRPTRCVSGRCRKRIPSSRIRARPIIIKHRIISDD